MATMKFLMELLYSSVLSLQSIMSDQYERFKKCLSAVAVISTDIQHYTLERVLNGEIPLIYISPESTL